MHPPKTLTDLLEQGRDHNPAHATYLRLWQAGRLSSTSAEYLKLIELGYVKGGRLTSTGANVLKFSRQNRGKTKPSRRTTARKID